MKYTKTGIDLFFLVRSFSKQMPEYLENKSIPFSKKDLKITTDHSLHLLESVVGSAKSMLRFSD